MSRKTPSSTYHDPLNLVRVPKNPLETEALTVIQTMQAQRAALQSAGSFGNEFDEAEINLDKWKQRRKTSVSKSSQESFGESPPRSSTMQSSARFMTINQAPVVEKSSRGSERNATQFSAKLNFESQASSEKESFAINPDNGLLRRGNGLSNVTKREEGNLEGIILRTRSNSNQASEASVEQRQQQDPIKSYVRKSENRFKDAKAFFELNAKQETDLLAPKPYKSANRSHQRMSWAPGMMEKTFSTQPPAKLPIANDKEFTIEEIDLSKPTVRMSTSDNVFKPNFTPRFVPNVESQDEAIIRKKSGNANERKSRMEVISMNLEDKEAPVISLDDFKSFITSPEVVEEKFDLNKKIASNVSSLKIEDVSKKDQSSKNTFLVEDKAFKNKMFNEDLDLGKVSSSKKITKEDFESAKQNNEKFKDENVYNENEFLKEGLFKITDYKKDSSKAEIPKVTKLSQMDFPLSLEEIEKKYKKSHVSKEPQSCYNNTTHTSVLNKKVSDILDKKMEDRKAFFESDIKNEKRHDVSVKTTMKNKDIVSSSALDEALSIKEEYKNEASENPFTLFEETYKSQLDELNERKARRSMTTPSDIFIEEKLDTTKLKKVDKIEEPFVSTFQTGITLKKSVNADTFVDGNVLIKSDDSFREKVKQQSTSKEQTKSSDSDANLISFSNDKKEGTISEKSDYKADFLSKTRDTIIQKESKIEPKDPPNVSISSKEVPKSEDPLLKTAQKAVPIVAPKPMSKTSKMVEKLTLSGFTPVLPGALPRRSKSMKVIGSAMTEATRRVVEEDEGGVDMDKVSSSRPLLDTSAQKNKSAIARNANRRPPTMYQTKMHSFDCSNGFDSKSTGYKTPQSASEDELGRSPPNLPTRPPPKSSLENLDNLLYSTSPPRSTAVSFDKPVDYIDAVPKGNADRRRREEICEEEEESVV